MSNELRTRIVTGRAAPDEAEAWIEGLESRLVRALHIAEDATNRLAQEKNAAQHLVEAIAPIVKAEPLSARARMAAGALERHEAESPDAPQQG